MRRWVALSAMLFFSAAAARAAERAFRVEHDHLLRHCEGELVFGDAGVAYKASEPGHSREWKYEDIQQLEVGRDAIAILGYDARKRELGRDQAFRFKVLEGAPDEALRKEMEEKLARPLVSSILPEDQTVRFSIPARHRKFMGGVQGALEFSDEYVVFRAASPRESRAWRYDELPALTETGSFRLRIGVLEKTGGEYGGEKPYNFDLKRRLTEAESDFLWEKVNRRHLR